MNNERNGVTAQALSTEQLPEGARPGITVADAVERRIKAALEKSLNERLVWLEQKAHEQRDPDSPDHTPSKLLIGRTEGEIGGIEWVIRELNGWNL